jgi:hypothetical protein
MNDERRNDNLFTIGDDVVIHPIVCMASIEPVKVKNPVELGLCESPFRISYGNTTGGNNTANGIRGDPVKLALLGNALSA